MPPESVTFTYNGSDTVVAMITSPQFGTTYRLTCGDPASSSVAATAAGPPVFLTVNTVGGLAPSETFYAQVEEDGTGFPTFGATVFSFGSTQEFAFVARWDFDGDKTVSALFTGSIGDAYSVTIIDSAGSGSNSDPGTGSPQTVTAVSSATCADDYFWAFLYDDTTGLPLSVRLFTAGLAGEGFPGNPRTNIPAPTQVFGGSRFYEAPPWRFIVTDLESNTLTFLDRLGLDRSVTITRAASRVISVRVPSDNPEVNIPAVVDGEPFVNEGTRLIYAFRREAPEGGPPWVVRAAGIVLETSDDADSDHATTTVTAYDPWKYLYRRPILTAGVVPGDYSYPAGATANEIIIDQLDLANITEPLFFDWGQTAFYTGTIETTAAFPNDGDGFAMTFRAGQTLGEMLDLLVATGTCDVVFDPIYDPDNRPGMVAQMSIYQRAGSFRANAVMGWDRWPRSVVQLSRQVLGTERANVMQMYAGQGGPAVDPAIDTPSLVKFGQYWALQYLPGVPSLAGAHTIAQRQLALLKDGLYTYSLSPAAERAPLLFEEYREADEVPLYASQRFRAPIDGVALRIESIPIVIGDDQLERVNQMLVSYAPESGS